MTVAVTVPRTRAHGTPAARAGGVARHAAARGSAAVAPAQARPDGARPARSAPARPRPEVVLVPAREELRAVARRRRALGLAIVGFVLLFGLMLGATALQTRLAQNQLRLDRIERDLAAAKQTYDVLRRQRAELRSPERLTIEAAALGMLRGTTSEFVSVDPMVAAQVLVATSGLPAGTEGAATPLEQFAEVKAIAGGAP